MRKLTLPVTTALLVLAAAAPRPAAAFGVPVGDDVFTDCVLNGGEILEDFGDAFTICRYPSGWEVWCDASGSGNCEFYPPSNQHPGHAGGASTSAPATSATAPAEAGPAGSAITLDGPLQLEIQR